VRSIFAIVSKIVRATRAIQRLILAGGEVGRFHDPARPHLHPEDVDTALAKSRLGTYLQQSRRLYPCSEGIYGVKTAFPYRGLAST